jgi:hypothetical protein
MKLARIARSISIIFTCFALCLCNIPLVNARTITIDASNSPTGDVVPPPPSPNIVNILEGAVVSGDVYGGDGAGNTINVSGGSIAGDVVGGSYTSTTAGTTITGSNNVNISGGAMDRKFKLHVGHESSRT